jgi:hypothetical protein
VRLGTNGDCGGRRDVGAFRTETLGCVVVLDAPCAGAPLTALARSGDTQGEVLRYTRYTVYPPFFQIHWIH